VIGVVLSPGRSSWRAAEPRGSGGPALPMIEDPFNVYRRLALTRINEREPALRAEARDPNTAPERLAEIGAEIMRAGWVPAAKVLARNPSTPASVLRDLATKWRIPELRTLVLQNPSCPSDLFESEAS